MKIVIDPFNKESVNAAIEQLKQYERDFKQKEAEFTRRLAEIGVTLARGAFAIADYDGTKDVEVFLEKTTDGYAVIAAGSTVGFLEFGTGIRNPEWSGDGLDYTPPAHGTYGKGHGKQPYGWWFSPNNGSKAVHTYGNPPAEAMLLARDTMVARVTQIAREVWK